MNLQEVLNKKTVEDLKRTASMYTSGYSKLRKQELVALCRDEILEKGGFAAVMESADESMLAFFDEAAQSAEGLLCKEEFLQYYTSLSFFGLAHIEACVDSTRIIIADEIRDLYRELCANGFSEKMSRKHLIQKYLRAAVNLYGVIEQMEFMRIFNMQNVPPITELELESFLTDAFIEEEDYRAYENFLINAYFDREEGAEEMEALLADACTKPRYIPEKEEFLRHEDPDYVQYTPHIAELENFFKQEYKLSATDAAELAESFAIMASFHVDMEMFFDLLKEYNVTVERPEPLLRRIALCANNVRIWENKGYTPNELHEMMQAMQCVGRNDPCPCGSGKKYKKCCGR